MKNTIKIMLVITTTILSTTYLSAQQQRPQGPPPIPDDEQIEEMVADLTKTLSLSEDQEEKVSKIYFDHFEEVAKLQEENKEKRGAGREAMEILNTELQEEVNTILDDEQKTLYTSWLEEQKKNRSKRGGPGKGRQ